jgi:type III secretory pathway component EscV
MQFMKGLIVAGIVVILMNAVLIYVALGVAEGDPVVNTYEREAR